MNSSLVDYKYQLDGQKCHILFWFNLGFTTSPKTTRTDDDKAAPTNDNDIHDSSPWTHHLLTKYSLDGRKYHATRFFKGFHHLIAGTSVCVWCFSVLGELASTTELPAKLSGISDPTKQLDFKITWVKINLKLVWNSKMRWFHQFALFGFPGERELSICRYVLFC
jgi:hypothetical protein